MIRSTKLTGPTIDNMRERVLSDGGLGDYDARSLICAAFSLKSQDPTPVEITQGIISVIGPEDGGLFRQIFPDRQTLGDIWKFTTDFGTEFVLQKNVHPGDNRVVLKLLSEFTTTNGDSGYVKETRSLAEYNARGIHYFTKDDVTTQELKELEDPKMAFDFTAKPSDDTAATGNVFDSETKFYVDSDDIGVRAANLAVRYIEELVKDKTYTFEEIAKNLNDLINNGKRKPRVPIHFRVKRNDDGVVCISSLIEEAKAPDVEAPAHVGPTQLKGLPVNISVSNGRLDALMISNIEGFILSQTDSGSWDSDKMPQFCEFIAHFNPEWKWDAHIANGSLEIGLELPKKKEEPVPTKTTVDVEVIGLDDSPEEAKKAADYLAAQVAAYVTDLAFMSEQLSTYMNRKCMISLDSKGEYTITVSQLDKPKEPVPERPEGISDADWAAIQRGETTVKEVLKLNEAMAEQEEALAEQHHRDVAGQVAAAEVATEDLRAEGKHEEADAIEQRTEEVKAGLDTDGDIPPPESLKVVPDSNMSPETLPPPNPDDYEDEIVCIKKDTVVDFTFLDEGEVAVHLTGEDGPCLTKFTDADFKELVYASKSYRAVCDVTNGMLRENQASVILEYFEAMPDPIINPPETPKKETPKMITVRILCDADVEQEEVDKIKTWLDANHEGKSDAELSEGLGDHMDYECAVSTITPNAEYVVKIPIEDDAEETTEETDEPEAGAELAEAMNSDKAPERQYLNLRDPDLRSRVIQILFPGCMDPSFVHLMNYLKDFYNGDQNYMATDGTFPTETTIVYDNITFAIVKMKDGRYWKIFAANTNSDLKDHSWLATRFMSDRWFQLGRNISDTQNYGGGGNFRGPRGGGRGFRR